jgi:alkaline phosphatase
MLMNRRIKIVFILLFVFNLAISPGYSQNAGAVPKNIIIFIGDGCGYNHIQAASLYHHGKEGMEPYQKFPLHYAVSTFSASGEGYDPEKAWSDFEYVLRKPTDSAASATALSSGVKTYDGAIGVDTSGHPLENIVEVVERLGKKSGVITSVQWSHATPAGFVAHMASRGSYEAIALQMLLESRADVIMGCGHPFYDDDGKISKDSVYKYVGGRQIWEMLMNGQAGNDADGDGQIDYWKLIEIRSEFQKLASGTAPSRLLGVPRVRFTLQQGRSGDKTADAYAVPFIEETPTLSEMTRAALNVLDDDPDGFFLMVEGGAIDWAGHGNQPGRLVEESILFGEAVQAGIDWTEQNSAWDETLILVTADHETGYVTGPGSGKSDRSSAGGEKESIWNPLVNNGKGQMPGFKFHSDEHSNSLVALYVKGAGSERFNAEIIGEDPVRGPYITNSSIGKVMISFFSSVHAH